MSGYINDNITFRDTNQRGISKLLRKISTYGQEYADQVEKNKRAVGVTQSPMGISATSGIAMEGDIYSAFAAFSNLGTTLNKNISFYAKNYPQKREELRQYAMQDEIIHALDIITDSAIHYDNMNYFCHADYKGYNLDPKILDDIDMYFNRLYNMMGFKDGIRAWDLFRKFMVDGYLAFEIIYDDDQKNIIALQELDSVTLVPIINPDDGSLFWQQTTTTNLGSAQRLIPDSSIIYISYSSFNSPERISYVENLIRPFNVLRMMESTRITWAVGNASFRMKFIIPVGDVSKNTGQQTLTQVMHNYRELVNFDWNSGVLETNGKPMMPFNKEYWLPSKNGESPQIETIGGDGPQLNDTESLKYFFNKYKLATRIPFNRWDDGNGAGSQATHQQQAEGKLQDELTYANFIDRLRAMFSELIIKPLRIQMCLKHPSLINDNDFKANLGLSYDQDNRVYEMVQRGALRDAMDLITSIKSTFTTVDKDGNEQQMIPMKWLMYRYKVWSRDELREIDKWKKIEELEGKGYSFDDAEKIADGADPKDFKKKGDDDNNGGDGDGGGDGDNSEPQADTTMKVGDL